jgi:AcrR family transcriptional regulator
VAPSEATPLQQLLSGAAPARRTALDAFSRARRMFLDGQRVDMGVLARDLGVNRATLYRWVGSRDQLLTEILWSLMRRTADRLLAADADAPGSSRSARVIDALLRAVIGNVGMQQFIDAEGELALRLLTTKASDFQARLVDLVHTLIADDLARGRLRTELPCDDLAFVVVRIMESYVYIGLITGERPDPDRAGRVIHALLPAGPPPARTRPTRTGP